jgi:hypothetical protein
MAGIKNLERFTLEETDEGYALTVGAEGGQSVEVAVTPDQMDAIIDALNDVLGADDEAFEIDDD